MYTQRRTRKRTTTNTKKKKCIINIANNAPRRPVHDYIDSAFSAQQITATTSVYNILDTVRTVLLPNYQIGWRPVINSNGSRALYAKMTIPFIDISLIFTGAQSTTLLPGDLFNSIRFCIVKVGSKASISVPQVLLSLTNFPELEFVEKLFIDNIVPLPTQAFDTVNSYNVPQVVRKQFRLMLGEQLDWFTQTGSGLSNWDTKKTSFALQFVSDSTVSPHPTIDLQWRVYYKFSMR